MTEYENTEKDDRQERYERKHIRDRTIASDTPRRRRTPYKREQVDYHYLQEEGLDDEWFEHDN